MQDCTFCRIIDGEKSAHVLARTDRSLAFLDANPAVDGHSLIVPKAHGEDLLLADASDALDVIHTAQRVARAMAEAMDPDGFSIFYSSASIAGNVRHAHLHLLPRDTEDSIHLSLPRRTLDDQAAEELASTLRAHV